MRLNDLTDQRFGRLTAVQYCPVEHAWLVLCDCGNLKLTKAANLMKGTKSCGRCSGAAVLVTPGQVFGRLTAVKRTWENGARVPGGWLCKCECGTQRVYRADYLVKGIRKSCGCGPKTGGLSPEELTARVLKPFVPKFSVNDICGDWRVLGIVVHNGRRRYHVECTNCGKGKIGTELGLKAKCSRCLNRVVVSDEMVEARLRETRVCPNCGSSFRAWFVSGHKKKRYKFSKNILLRNEAVHCSRSCAVTNRVENHYFQDDESYSRVTYNIRFVEAFGERKSVAAWSRDSRCAVCYGTLKQRIYLGWESERAIMTPSMNSRPVDDKLLEFQKWVTASLLSIVT